MSRTRTLDAARMNRRRMFLETVDKAQADLWGKGGSPLDKIYEHAFSLITSKGAKAVFDLEQEQEKLRTIQATLQDGMILMNSSGVIGEANDEWVSLFGLSCLTAGVGTRRGGL